MGILERLMGQREPRPPLAARIGPATAARFSAFVAEARRLPQHSELAAYESLQAILDAPPADSVDAVHACFDFLYEFVDSRGAGAAPREAWKERQGVVALASRLLKRKLPFSDDDLAVLIDTCRLQFHWLPSTAIVRAVERRPEGTALSEPLRGAITQLREELLECSTSADTRAIVKRLEQLLHGKTAASFTLEPVDAWTVAMRTAIDNLGSAERMAWVGLLEHCARATSARPTVKWTKQAKVHLRDVSDETFRDVTEIAFEALGTPAPFPVQVPDPWQGGSADGDPRLVSDRYANCLRGLIWCNGLLDRPDREALLGDTAERCYKKLPEHGPLTPKAGNACLTVLAEVASHDAIGQLTRLKSRVKHASSRTRVAKALDRAAAQAGLEPEDLEDLAVPTCGLTEVGLCRQAIGGFQAELRVTGTRSTTLTWIKPDCKTQKSVPKTVKTDHADRLKLLKRSAKEIPQLLAAQRDRIERQLLNRRTLPFATWRDRYLDHPLVGFLARRLIWRVGGDDGAALATWRDGGLVQLGGAPVDPAPETPVRLWHPIESAPETVRAWREWLVAQGVMQPFKQAHREIYLVTDAERTTGTYSNRFAAHVLKQHQFKALAGERGWRYEFQGMWDSHNSPTLDLTELGWRAEFWVDYTGDTQSDVTEMAVFLYIVTDQVRFYRADEQEPCRVVDVPAVIFSEVLRDVDLFVGVSSVANDPTWMDGGDRGRQGAQAQFGDYWQMWSFGELNETAKTRKEILATLLPKLKISERCTLAGRYLTVRGDLRTYRIHLGSGNIQMEPNNEYLCVVPGRRSGQSPANVMLPFEGDRMLSIILSKALMLANDRTIEDPTITSQLNRA